jgi:CheY-like chemotaxis protein
MRKPRAIIYDDNALLLSVLKEYLTFRGYEVLAAQDPVVCPLCDNSAACTVRTPCTDIIITDFNMPKINGIELLKAQFQKGCKVPAGSKVLMSGNIDNSRLRSIKELGTVFFEKPFSFELLSDWLDGREQLMDLSQPLGIT